MIGIQYLKYYPKRIFSLQNGFMIYESQLINPDGSRGVVGGPRRLLGALVGCLLELTRNLWVIIYVRARTYYQ